MLTVLLIRRGRATRLGSTLAAYEQLDPPRGGCRLVVDDDGSSDTTSTVLSKFGERFAPGTLVVFNAAVLGVAPAAASKRYVRALARLRAVLVAAGLGDTV